MWPYTHSHYRPRRGRLQGQDCVVWCVRSGPNILRIVFQLVRAFAYIRIRRTAGGATALEGSSSKGSENGPPSSPGPAAGAGRYWIVYCNVLATVLVPGRAEHFTSY